MKNVIENLEEIRDALVGLLEGIPNSDQWTEEENKEFNLMLQAAVKIDDAVSDLKEIK